MNGTAALLKRVVPDSLKPLIRHHLGLQRPCGFYVADSIEEQVFSFRWRGRQFTIRADRRTPVYETIAEVVDYDSYQLSRVTWPDRSGYIVDIGANIGVTAVVFSQLPCQRVICFEPVLENWTALESNLALNGISNVSVFHSAVSNARGVSSFEVSPASVGGKLSRRLPSQGRGELIQVECVSLKDVLADCGEENVDLMKIDCEGGEYGIVDQITPEIAARILAVTFEVHDLDSKRNSSKLAEKLVRLGYELHLKPDMWDRPTLSHILAVRPGS